LNGRETWFLILREEHTMMVFVKSLLRRIFDSTEDEHIGGWRKMHNEKLHNFYCLLDVIGMIESR
jgi:hypothetical protein